MMKTLKPEDAPIIGRTRLAINIMKRLYKDVNRRRARQLIIACIARLEGGELYSRTIRDLLLKHHNIGVGLYSYGGCFNLGQIAENTEIGRYCSFADKVSVFNSNHPKGTVSTHPFFYNINLGFISNGEMVPINKLVIGNDVWFGSHSIIIPSVSKIGDGAIIGAGSVVTTNVPPFAVVGGNPAKVVKYRFSKEKIRIITETSWWEKDIKDLDIDWMIGKIPSMKQ